MRAFAIVSVLLLATIAEAASKQGNRVLLSNVKSLTLRKDAKTSHRRVPAVPQLKCIGGDAKGLYDVDVMQCRNQGSDYDVEKVQWTCTASLPPEFRLTTTDVICEGYESSDDPFVLKGSCGVEYRLMLTTFGEEKYGRRDYDVWQGSQRSGSVKWASVIFWGIFISVVAWMLYSALTRPHVRRMGTRGNGPWGGWGGGGGGGGGGNPGGDDPPPPYSRYAPPRTKSGAGAFHSGDQQSWRPGFWTGAAAGAAGAYLAGNRGQAQRNQGNTLWGNRQPDNGEGSSNGRVRSSNSSSFSTRRYESSGFGSTSRR